jgi:hypothetical protein
VSTKDDALIEKMARAICLAEGRDPDLEENNVADGVFLPNWTMFNSGANAALTVARKAILEEAAAKVRKLQCTVEEDFDEGYNEGLVDAEAAIAALSTQEQHNEHEGRRTDG